MSPSHFPALAPAPPSFLPAVRPRSVSLYPRLPSYIRRPRSSRPRYPSLLQRRGISYEARCTAALFERFDRHYSHTLPFANAALHFRDGQQWRWCSPDFFCLHLNASHSLSILLLEMKLSHCDDAWHQLRYLYLPVLRALFFPLRPRFRFAEVCYYFNGDGRFPVFFSLDEFLDSPHTFGVIRWRP